MSIVPRSPISTAATATGLFSGSPFGGNGGGIGSANGNGIGGLAANGYPYGHSRSNSVHSSPILRPIHRLPGQGFGAREREEREKAVRQINGAATEGVRKIALSNPPDDQSGVSADGIVTANEAEGQRASGEVKPAEDVAA